MLPLQSAVSNCSTELVNVLAYGRDVPIISRQTWKAGVLLLSVPYVMSSGWKPKSCTFPDAEVSTITDLQAQLASAQQAALHTEQHAVSRLESQAQTSRSEVEQLLLRAEAAEAEAGAAQRKVEEGASETGKLRAALDEQGVATSEAESRGVAAELRCLKAEAAVASAEAAAAVSVAAAATYEVQLYLRPYTLHL